jgi:hypothetical protein
MRRFTSVLIMGVLAVMVAGVTSNGPFAQNGSKVQNVPTHQYEVLNPWAEVDPKPVRGISPRLASLEGKKIGLFGNYKRASIPMLTSFEKRLKEKYSTSQTSVFHSTGWNVIAAENEKAKFESWLKGLDAVVAAVGD